MPDVRVTGLRIGGGPNLFVSDDAGLAARAAGIVPLAPALTLALSVHEAPGALRVRPYDGEVLEPHGDGEDRTYRKGDVLLDTNTGARYKVLRDGLDACGQVFVRPMNAAALLVAPGVDDPGDFCLTPKSWRRRIPRITDATRGPR